MQLVYDKQCPACDQYARLVRVRESAGELELVNAREATAVMQEITAAGLDIDAGMVLKVDGQLYHGADAIHALAVMGTGSDVFNRLNCWLFGSRVFSRLIYPLLRAGRNLLLKIRGIRGIDNLSAGKSGQA